MVDEDVIRKIVQAMDEKTLRIWKTEVVTEGWTRHLARIQVPISAQLELLSDEELKQIGLSDESIRLLRLAEKTKREH